MSKVTITVSAQDFVEALKNLKLNEEFKEHAEFTIELDIADNKENFKYLCNSGKIKNWDFLEMPTNIIEEKVEEGKSTVCTNPEYDDFYKIFRQFTELEDFRNNPYELMLKIIKVVSRIKIKSPALRFTKSIFEPYISSKNLIIDLNNSEDNIYIKLLKYYYKDVSYEEMLDHVLRGLKSKWKDIEKCEKNISNIISLITT